ncbi:MAG TPA: hypothetical protein VHK69_04255 [Chitinophagaceae bacterium]|jgi:hypothetical protein|nr:hypothetical protein [Chitinophagaceae bacterium]
MIVTEEQKREAHAFYHEALVLLKECGAPFMLGGAFSMFHHTGIYRDTKDLDVFCKASDYPKILKFFQGKGYEVQVYDVRWLMKIYKGEYFIDIIFDTTNNICTVDDTWFEHAPTTEFAGVSDIKMLAAEELIFCKSYVQNRERYDGADINHVLLKKGKDLDWKRLLRRLDRHWHLLLSHLLLFQFVYPSDYREIIPQWLFEELLERARTQYDLPSPMEKVCRGTIIDNTQYQVDVKEWGYLASTIKTT